MKKIIIGLITILSLNSQNISIVGSGYVGLTTGVCFAEGGHRITCVDINSQRVENLNKGIIPIYEDGLEEIFNRNLNKNLFFTDNSKEAILNDDYIFLAVNTPSRNDGSCNLDYLHAAFKTIVDTVKEQQKPKIVCTKSTVAIGTNKTLQDIADKEVPGLITVVSNPEFLREGLAIYDCFNPSRIVVGAKDKEAAKKVAGLYGFLNVPKEKILITDTTTAELIKYASNTFLALKLVYINELADYCNRIGASIEDTSSGMGMDERIGKLFLNAGPGIAGSCFPKDVKSLDYSLKNENIEGLINNISKADMQHKELIISVCRDFIENRINPKIAILGLTFKSGTDDLRDSISLMLIDNFKDTCQIAAYDPKGMENAKLMYPKLSYANNAVDACKDANLVILATEWNEFKDLDLKEVAKVVKNKNIVDLRNMLSVKDLKENGFNYYNLGRIS